MALQIPLDVVPNQELSISVDGDYYWLSLRTNQTGAMYISIMRNNDQLTVNTRIVNGQLLLGPISLWEGHGNFIFYCDNGEDVPNYKELNTTFILVYLTNTEALSVRNAYGTNVPNGIGT